MKGMLGYGINFYSHHFYDATTSAAVSKLLILFRIFRAKAIVEMINSETLNLEIKNLDVL